VATVSSRVDFLDGKLMFSPVDYKPPDMTRFQGAMFLDRPDLWPCKRRRRSKPVPPEQQPLPDSEDTPG